MQGMMVKFAIKENFSLQIYSPILVLCIKKKIERKETKPNIIKYLALHSRKLP